MLNQTCTEIPFEVFTNFGRVPKCESIIDLRS